MGRVLLMTLAGILALDVGLVAGLASLHASKQRRARREIEQLETLWRLRPGRAPRSTVPARAARRRLVALGALVAVVGAGTAYAHPAARDLVTSIVDTVVGGVEAADPYGQGSDRELGADGPEIGRAEAPRGVPAGRRAAEADPTPSQTASVGAIGRHAPRPPIAGPATPSALVAVAASSNTIVLTWTDVIAEDGYRVDRSTDGLTGWVTISTVAPDVTSHTDAGLPSGTTFYYRIVATGGGGTSPPSGVASATTDLALVSPATLTAVTASSSVIELAWNDVAAETGYRIERSDDGVTGWTAIATTGQDVTTFSDTALPPGATYSYRVVATNAGGESPPSNVASATTGMDAERPVPPPDPPLADPSSGTPPSEARFAD